MASVALILAEVMMAKLVVADGCHKVGISSAWVGKGIENSLINHSSLEVFGLSNVSLFIARSGHAEACQSGSDCCKTCNKMIRRSIRYVPSMIAR